MIQRTIFQELLSDLPNKEISLVVGPRQAGKTTAMRWVEERVRRRGTRTVYLNLDIEADQPFFESQQAFFNKLRLELGSENGVAFIDEIQRKENAGLFLKGLFDRGLSCKRWSSFFNPRIPEYLAVRNAAPFPSRVDQACRSFQQVPFHHINASGQCTHSFTSCFNVTL